MATRQSSGWVFLNELDGGPPELVTQISRRPKRSSTAATKAATAAESATSRAWWKTSRPVDLWMCAAASASVAEVREQMATLAPSRASSSATERPSPLLAAATMATRPVRPRSNLAPYPKLPSSRETRSASINAPISWIMGQFIERAEEWQSCPRTTMSGDASLLECCV